MRYIFLLFLSLTLGAVALHAQRKQLSRAAIDSLRALKNTENTGSPLQFVASKKDMGAMYESDPVTDVKFLYKNISDRVVKISKITTSCGCTVAQYSTDDIPAGASGTIIIKFNPRGRDGTVDTDAFVYLQGDSTPSARLVLAGNVVAADEWGHFPVKMGQLRLKRKQVQIDDVQSGAMRVERLACVNVGITPVSIGATLQPKYMQIKTEPTVLQPGEEGDLIIAVDGSAIDFPTDTVRLKIPIEGVVCRPSSRTLDITICKKNENK